MNKGQVVLTGIAFFVFLGAFIFAVNSPLYHQKKAMERELAIEYLSANLYLIESVDRAEMMKEYGLTEADLEVDLLPAENAVQGKTDLLEKNPIVKFLLGL